MDDMISKQQAVNALYEWECDNKDDRDAIDVINGLPPIQPASSSETPNNSDTISRQAAIDALCNDYCGGHQDCKYYPKCENLKSIQQLPSAQPEIIRCKDCIMHGLCRFEQGLGLDGYCSQAERRTDE